ncbi:MAG: adaptor protein MecA [Clostridiales bacterium]|jgi:adapter protein MecA 1/2|nr:adaptor protein MecA [Clostridiales bacterium]
MRIEKISETQVKFILNQADLSSRNLKISELAYGSEKMSGLFRDMMDQAIRECGFVPENNVPLMIEAIPLSQASIMIIVTKVANPDDFEQKLSLLPPSKDERKYVKRPIVENAAPIFAESETAIYMFANFSSLTDACGKLRRRYFGDDSLYEMNGKFYLMLGGGGADAIDGVDAVFSEYGQKQYSAPNSRYYIMEHGRELIKKNAISRILTL